MSKSKMFLTVRREQSRQYAHCYVSVYQTPESSYHSGTNPLFSAQWQSDSEQSSPCWYGSRMTLEAQGYNMVEQLRKVANLLGKFPLTDDPTKWVQSLVDAGIERRVYDDRKSQYIPVGEVLDCTHKRWMACGVDGYCICATVAASEDDAKRQITQEFAGQMASYGSQSWATKFADWMARGQPVIVDDYRRTPETPSLSELLTALCATHS